ncbi:FAD:protein FMN transferase [Propionicimonas sp.]|uniref:FAD:protein FMN transferase n=1 Tax=Propionicimonas sp. TaxID=1955623 RepID=UPI0018570027|nr:FAD:protein FMN transferase [Propionicimonas sp.]MBU3976045.1 FAD:protein FMN transferase [Actinomycetota bacterium]MBA3020858.1 FAD:protein FMN transferase [Propionicimonas sp.]MBU3985235.1 FAD:protein FMN transferase [Actinomycetota bacterium]MBU4008225.1 FAD:protein FMN transferase [Actinomycetota bacterium]MBU4064561.1 FAD:protein FMN transferase [Actinomycetota bacterium]
MRQLATRSPVLGTVVELRLDGTPAATSLAEAAAWERFESLEQVFSTYSADSELSRWRAGDVLDCSAELSAVLTAAEHWHRVSGGAFHPLTRALTRRWQRAEAEGRLPSTEELAALREPLPYVIGEAGAVRTGDCAELDLNAIAKGYIVDCAARDALAVPGMTAVVVNAGGDLRHLGDGSVSVGIEDPAKPFDNLPARWRVQVSNAALATSGSARRGFRVGEHWLGHVLDPRTGWPVAHTASISVLANDALSADALATVLGVLAPTEALEFAAAAAIGCLLVTADGAVRASPAWPGQVS